MADGTVPPRAYRDPTYCVLMPHVALHQQLFLSWNGVVSIYGDVLAAHLRIADRLPTIAANILRPGRGQWPSDVTCDRGAGKGHWFQTW